MNTEENDITIGPLKLLGLFFMLVAICGVFFAIGYSLGKTSAHEQALNDKGPMSASVSAPVVGNPNAAKPSAGVAAKTERENNAGSEAASDSSAPDLTFFNAVKRSDRNAPATSADGYARGAARERRWAPWLVSRDSGRVRPSLLPRLGRARVPRCDRTV